MKKGFTLIELLAVILILGIIALIAVPQVTNVISNASKGAAETSAKHYLDAVNNVIALNQLDTDASNDVADNADPGYTVSALAQKGVNFTGEGPSEGYVQVSGGNIVGAYGLKINGYTVGCTAQGRCTATAGE